MANCCVGSNGINGCARVFTLIVLAVGLVVNVSFLVSAVLSLIDVGRSGNQTSDPSPDPSLAKEYEEDIHAEKNFFVCYLIFQLIYVILGLAALFGTIKEHQMVLIAVSLLALVVFVAQTIATGFHWLFGAANSFSLVLAAIYACILVDRDLHHERI